MPSELLPLPDACDPFSRVSRHHVGKGKVHGKDAPAFPLWAKSG